MTISRPSTSTSTSTSIFIFTTVMWRVKSAGDNGAFNLPDIIVITAAYLLLILQLLFTVHTSPVIFTAIRNEKLYLNNKHSIVCTVWHLFPHHISIISYGVAWDPLQSLTISHWDPIKQTLCQTVRHQN